MGSDAPNHTFNSITGEPTQLPPITPQWKFEHTTLQPIPNLHERHISYLSEGLGREINDHNNTRSRLQRYISLYMKSERGQSYERAHVEYLTNILQDLKAQLEAEKTKRQAAEDTNAALLQRDMENLCSGLSPLAFEQQPANDSPPALSESRSSRSSTIVEPDNGDIWRLEQLADAAIIAGSSNGLLVAAQFSTEEEEDSSTIPEYFALDIAELEAVCDAEMEVESETGRPQKKRKFSHTA